MSLSIKSETALAKGLTPKYGGIDTWCALTGMSVRGTYDRLAAGDLVAVKVGSRTLLNIEKGLAWLETQPQAQIKPQVRRKSHI